MMKCVITMINLNNVNIHAINYINKFQEPITLLAM